MISISVKLSRTRTRQLFKIFSLTLEFESLKVVLSPSVGGDTALKFRINFVLGSTWTGRLFPENSKLSILTDDVFWREKKISWLITFPLIVVLIIVKLIRGDSSSPLLWIKRLKTEKFWSLTLTLKKLRRFAPSTSIRFSWVVTVLSIIILASYKISKNL